LRKREETGNADGAGMTTSRAGAAGETESPSSGPRDRPSTQKSALIVDDDEKVRRMLAELLSKVGFCCVEAADGEAALEALKGLGDDQTPQLGVLDLVLPGMSGAELAWKLRKRLPDVPLVAISGHLSSWDPDDLEDLGFDRIFPKPMDCDDFVEYCRGLSGWRPGAKPC
jgi:DNA-binding response OmpR family regulator